MDDPALADELGFITSSLGLAAAANGKLFDDDPFDLNLVDLDEDHLNAASDALATYFEADSRDVEHDMMDPWLQQNGNVHRQHMSFLDSTSSVTIKEASRKKTPSKKFRSNGSDGTAVVDPATEFSNSQDIGEVEIEVVGLEDNYGSNSSDGEMDMPDYDWIKSSPDANSDSEDSTSMSPLPRGERGGHGRSSSRLMDDMDEIIIKQEIAEECEAPSPVNTVTISSNSGDSNNFRHRDLTMSSSREHPSIELHNYSTAFNGSSSSVVEKMSKSAANKKQQHMGSVGSISPCSSVSSSPNARKSGHGGGGRTGRGKPISELSLTEEERRLLSKEGYADFPSGNIPLTKQEEKVLRKVRRKIRNKRSAQCSRQRKKEYVEELEKKHEKCTSENDCLRREVMKLRKENSSLLMKMKNLVSGGGSGGGQTSMKTSFFVLILSFLLVLVPFFRPDSLDDGLVAEKETFGTGRHLLMAPFASDSDHYYTTVSSTVNDSTEALVNFTSSLF